jgi:glycosyltransferase involved in cell wall biosynthesis
MSDSRRVSVLMAAHNAEPFINEAVESIRAQTHANWELVICDDASVDQTPIKCDHFTRQDSRIKVVHLAKKGGLSNARNRAFAASTGEYVTVLDADDSSTPDRLERQLAEAKAHPNDIIMTGYRHFGANVPAHCDLYLPHHLANAGLWACPLICGATMMMDRRLFEKLNGYAVHIPDFQDLDIVLRAGLLGHPFRTMPCELYNYRIHPNSLTGQDRLAFHRRINVYLTSMWQTHLADPMTRERLYEKATYGLERDEWPIGRSSILSRKASAVALNLAIRFASFGDNRRARRLINAAIRLCWWRGDGLLSRLFLPLGLGMHLTSFGDRRLPRVVLTRRANLVAMI